jgi:hypothetical protein
MDVPDLERPSDIMVSRYIGAFECSAQKEKACGLSRSVFVRQLCFEPRQTSSRMPPVPSEEQHERLEPTQTLLLKDRRFKLSRSVIPSPPFVIAMTSANPVGPTCQSVRSMQVSKLVVISVLRSLLSYSSLSRRRRIKCDEGYPCQPCRHVSSACTFEEAGKKSHPHKSKYVYRSAHPAFR